MTDEFLVCALADAEYSVSGSSFDKHCTKCNKRVMVSPSGQNMLKSHPSLHIVCNTCARPVLDEPTTAVGLAGTPEEFIRDLKNQRPNLWRGRN